MYVFSLISFYSQMFFWGNKCLCMCVRVCVFVWIFFWLVSEDNDDETSKVLTHFFLLFYPSSIFSFVTFFAIKVVFSCSSLVIIGRWEQWMARGHIYVFGVYMLVRTSRDIEKNTYAHRYERWWLAGRKLLAILCNWYEVQS